MIHPSYTELISAINNNAEDDDNNMMLNSRYSLVLATSKRARQLVSGEEPLIRGAAGRKPLSIAIDEFYQGKVKIAATGETDDESIRPSGAVSGSKTSMLTEEALEEEEAAKGKPEEEENAEEEDLSDLSEGETAAPEEAGEEESVSGPERQEE